MRLLCIDDSATMRKIISMAMKSAGHEVAEAENGKAGLELLTALKPDCVLLDMNMPEMSGLDFLRAKSEGAGAGVPVVVITTEADDGARAGQGARGGRLPSQALPERGADRSRRPGDRGRLSRLRGAQAGRSGKATANCT